MSTRWAEQFAPTGMSLRPSQEKLGNAVINTIDSGGILTGEASTGTGKSLAASIPTIHKIKEQKSLGKVSPRSVISTETITLQTQLSEKDLPLLQKIYGGFTFTKLLGRSNYLCFNQALQNAIGNKEVSELVNQLKKYQPNMISGERADVEKALGKFVSREMWEMVTGSSDFCSSNDCNAEECFGTKARVKAIESDIVVVNHALLATDFELKSANGTDGILGGYDILVVDECHKLEEVLVSQWTEKMTEWEVKDHSDRILKGIVKVNSLKEVFRDYEELLTKLHSFFTTTLEFFSTLQESRGQDWKGSETPICLHYLTNPENRIASLMEQYETMGPAIMEALAHEMPKLKTKLDDEIKENYQEHTKKSLKEMRKALTSIKFLERLASILSKSLESKDGVIPYGGTTYGVIADGWVRRKDGSKGMTIRCFPIDVSGSASAMFSSNKATILLSATISDLTTTDGNFRYFKRSLGIRNSVDIKVNSPFDMNAQQLTYVTAARDEPEDGTFFSAEELVDLVNAAEGRSLILFTSRREIELAHQALLQYKIAGKFNYNMLIQETGSDKAALVEEFKNDTYSVLLGLKSMFTGIDIPGESLSLVIICRWPLPRYSPECRMKIKYWRQAGFPSWYERESLTTFQQAAGRLIRSNECLGTVALLDQRAFDPGQNVFKTASLGVKSLGSRVTHSVDDVRNHLQKVGEPVCV